MARWFAYGLAVLVALITFVPQIVRADWWLLRALDFPRAQIFVLALVAAGSVAPFAESPRRRPRSAANVLLALALGAAVLQGARILPYTALWRDQVHTAAAEGPALRLLVANVLVDNRDAAPLLAQVAAGRPDMVILTEPDDWWARALRPLRERYPHVVEVPQDNAYGMILYSRLPLIEPTVHRLVEPDIPSIYADVDIGGRRVALRFVHPRPPVPTESPTTTERDAELLLVGREVRRLGRPAVVAGDLNDVAWSRTTRLFQRISGTLDPRRGRGLYSTFPADYPFLRWPLDHVFHTEHFELAHLERLGHNGSDHFPILVELRLTPAGPREQEPLPVDEGDREEAVEQIEEGR